MLNTDSRRRSAVGRMSRDAGEARLRPLSRPPTTRISALALPRLQITLAVIAPLRAARRAITMGLRLVTGAGLLVAGALDQNAAALAVGDQCALAGGLEGLLAARHCALFLAAARLFGRREIGARLRNDLVPKLLAQHPRFDLRNFALSEFAELKRPIGNADQPVHFESEMRKHIAHLAVLPLPDREDQPDIGPLFALQSRIDGSVFHVLDLEPILQLVELCLRYLAMGAHAIAAQPA